MSGSILSSTNRSPARFHSPSRRIARKMTGNELLQPYSKSKLQWGSKSMSVNRATFCQLISKFIRGFTQLNLTKLKLEYLKFGFKCKRKDIRKTNFFCITRVRFFSSSAQVCFKNTVVNLLFS